MRRLFLLLILAFILPACSSGAAPIAYQCPTIVLPPDPKNPASKLGPQASPDEVIKAWVATAVAYYEWNKIVRAQAKALQPRS